HSAEFWLSAIGPEIEENPDPAARAQFLRGHGLENFDYAEGRLRQLADSGKIRFISIEPKLTEYAERNHLSLRGFFNTRPNYGHWNESGNAAAAEVVASELLRRDNLFDPPVQSTQRKAAPNRGGS